jgi:hypothetical protein
VSVAANTLLKSRKPGEWLLSIVTLMLWGATVRLVRGSEKSAQRQLRAYVFVSGATLENFEEGKVPRLTHDYKNTGQTPAYKLTSISAIIVRRSDDTGQFPNPEDTVTYLPGEHPKTALGPDMSRSASPGLADKPLTADEVNGIKDGSLTLYFLGKSNTWTCSGKIDSLDLG